MTHLPRRVRPAALVAASLFAACSSEPAQTGDREPAAQPLATADPHAAPSTPDASTSARPDPATPTPAPPAGVVDRDTGVLWSVLASDVALTAPLANFYCVREGEGWHLPNKAELASMFIGDDDTGRRRLKPDHAAAMPAIQKLWSGEDVSSTRRGEKWVVNLANGHIYNGHGGVAHVRCVHGDPLVPGVAVVLSDTAYTSSLGPADATRTVSVFCQYGYHCGKARTVVAQLVADGVRLEWKHWVIRDRLEHYSLAACAAAAQGKFPEMHELLWDASTAKASAVEVRKLAEGLGLDVARFDADVANACPNELEATARQAKALELTGTPSIVVRNVAFNPLTQRDELLRAVDQLGR